MEVDLDIGSTQAGAIEDRCMVRRIVDDHVPRTAEGRDDSDVSGISAWEEDGVLLAEEGRRAATTGGAAETIATFDTLLDGPVVGGVLVRLEIEPRVGQEDSR